MVYDEKVVERIRRVIPPTSDVVEKKMFGGVAFLLDGKMFVGIANKDLMVRVGPDAYETALARPHVRVMDFTGRPLTGYIYVSPAGTRTDDDVSEWVQQAMSFVRTLPKKAKKKAGRPRKTRTRRRDSRR